MEENSEQQQEKLLYTNYFPFSPDDPEWGLRRELNP
jgi:hypothetical protein